ncbi:MAG: hypothetical protein AVDCRST_MAG18-925, partial [uncultured Thermomicrobiales bacterium]
AISRQFHRHGLHRPQLARARGRAGDRAARRPCQSFTDGMGREILHCTFAAERSHPTTRDSRLTTQLEAPLGRATRPAGRAGSARFHPPRHDRRHDYPLAVSRAEDRRPSLLRPRLDRWL